MNLPALPKDPRWFQITVLSGLLGYGVFALDFSVGLERFALTLAVALGSQWGFGKLFGVERFDPKSAWITSLSLTLLLRVPHEGWVALAAFLAIASKFLVRVRGKHIFNPANFAIVVLLALGSGWVTPGQWGAFALFAVALGGAGVFVTARSSRFDITLAFLAAFASLHVGRALWLGDPLTIPLHTLQSGAVLLFAFFMLSDPKTTPNSRTGRILFAVLVALVAFGIRFTLYRSDGVMWALALVAPFSAVIDYLISGPVYQWPSSVLAAVTAKPKRGEHHVAT